MQQSRVQLWSQSAVNMTLLIREGAVIDGSPESGLGKAATSCPPTRESTHNRTCFEISLRNDWQETTVPGRSVLVPESLPTTEPASKYLYEMPEEVYSLGASRRAQHSHFEKVPSHAVSSRYVKRSPWGIHWPKVSCILYAVRLKIIQRIPRGRCLHSASGVPTNRLQLRHPVPQTFC